MEALHKWKQVTTELQKFAKGKKKAEDFKDFLKSPHLLSAMEDLRSPLNPALMLQNLMWVLISSGCGLSKKDGSF